MRIGIGSTLTVMVLLVLGTASAAHAQGDSGFLRGKGKLDVSLSYSLDTYDEFWVGSRKVSNPPFGRVDRHAVNVHAAYGLTDEADLTLNGSFVNVETARVFDDEDALQDLAAQLKLRLGSWRFDGGSFNVLAAPGLKIPMRSYEANAVNAIGDGQVDLRTRIIFQCALDNGAFVALETGYDFRLDEPPDEVPLHLTAGFTVGPVTLSGFYSRIESRGGYDIGQGPFPGLEEEYERVGGGIYWRLDERLGVSATGWTTLDGRNTGDVEGFSVGLVLRF